MYRPRDAEHTVLHQVIALHLDAFLGAVAEAGDGAGLPQFVELEFRESFSAFSTWMSGMATSPPSRASASTMPRPIPLPPPVTTATLPASRMETPSI